MASVAERRGDGAARSRWPPAGSAPPAPTPVVGCVHPGRRRRTSSARASTPTPAARTPRSSRCAAGRRAGPGRHRRGHPGALQPHRPHRPLHPGADRGRGGPGRGRRRDPNPVAAGGPRPLRAAGRRGRDGGARGRGRGTGNVAWLTAVRRGRPYVIWKYAATLDGRSAAADGTSKWITSDAARADVHALRGTVDAIIVGVGTVLADDPQLTVRDLRDGSLAIRQPLRVVVDSRRAYPGRRPGPRRRRAHLDRHRRGGRRRPGRPGRPARAARRAVRPRGPRGAAGGRPDAGRRVPRRRPGRPGRRLRRAEAARRRARRRWPTPA